MLTPRTPRREPGLLEEWSALETTYLAAGLSRRRAHAQIAREYGVGPTTVRYYLISREMRLHRDCVRAYNRRQRARQRERIHRKRECDAEYRRRLEVRPRRKAYDTRYHSVIRHMYAHLIEALPPDDPMDLDEISIRLAESTGICFKKKTLQKYLASAPPEFEELEPGVYRYRSPGAPPED
jgi:AcrR family transcriptional regulator